MPTTPSLSQSEFMLLFRNGGPDTHAHLNTEQRARLAKQWNDWVDKLTREGRMKQGRPLALDGRVVTGSPGIVTDGPYAETTEVVAGYIAVLAANIDEAAEIAKECPGLPIGLTIEVRQLMDFSPVLSEVKGRSAESVAAR